MPGCTDWSLQRPVMPASSSAAAARVPFAHAANPLIIPIPQILFYSRNQRTIALSLQIIHYPHPVLRHPSKPLKRVDAELRNIVAEMFDLMYEHEGVGLAANQVDLPYRLFVANPEGSPDAQRGRARVHQPGAQPAARPGGRRRRLPQHSRRLCARHTQRNNHRSSVRPGRQRIHRRARMA